MKRILSLILMLSLLVMPLCVPAQAAAKVVYGFMTEGSSIKLGSKLGGIPVGKYSFTSTDTSVASVSNKKIVASAVGKAMITATYGGKSALCAVTVLPKSISIAKGATYTLPRAGVESYSMANRGIASVSKSGVITALTAGSTKLTVKYKTQKVTVNVTVTADAGQQSAAAWLDCAGSASQIVLVEHTSGSKATLSLHEKKNGVWTQLSSCSAYVGKNGIGKTREGDGKTPTGTFNLTTPFGINSDPGSNMGYTKVTKYHYWCGTSGSELYNQLVDTRVTDRKATSSDEVLINYKGVYNYCMFIDYNAKGEANLGSCIFLHCKGKGSSTAGCIAVDTSVMKNIIKWAKPGCKIVIR